MLETVKKTYYRKFAFAGILTIFLGAVVAAFILYVSLSREPGSSYAESYTMLSALREELLRKSAAIYIATSVFIALGIAFISLLYSFRVAGPVYRLGVFSRKIASGDLSGAVKLRQHDVIHMMADDLNNLTARYREVILQMEGKTRELREIVAAIADTKGDGAGEGLARLHAKRDEINRILSNIKL